MPVGLDAPGLFHISAALPFSFSEAAVGIARCSLTHLSVSPRANRCLSAFCPMTSLGKAGTLVVYKQTQSKNLGAFIPQGADLK